MTRVWAMFVAWLGMVAVWSVINALPSNLDLGMRIVAIFAAAYSSAVFVVVVILSRSKP